MPASMTRASLPRVRLLWTSMTHVSLPRVRLLWTAQQLCKPGELHCSLADTPHLGSVVSASRWCRCAPARSSRGTRAMTAPVPSCPAQLPTSAAHCSRERCHPLAPAELQARGAGSLCSSPARPSTTASRSRLPTSKLPASSRPCEAMQAERPSVSQRWLSTSLAYETNNPLRALKCA